MGKKRYIDPCYTVRRISMPGDPHYVVNVRGTEHRISKRSGGWFAGTRYHKTLRDAIIYCSYGIGAR